MYNYSIFHRLKEVFFMAKKNMFLYESPRINPIWNFGIIKADTKNCDWLENSIHWHDYFEMEIVYEGTSRHLLNENTYITKPGDAYIMNYFDYHTHKHINKSIAYLYNFNFNDIALPSDIINILLNHKGDLFCHFEGEEFEELLKDVNYLFAEDRKPNDAIHAAMMTAVFTKIVLTILRKCEIDIPEEQDSSSTYLNKAIALTQCHFREPLTLQQLASQIGLTPNYLGQLFKNNLDKSFSEYLLNLRLKYSKNLLKRSNYSISQIAGYSGFSTTSYFIQCFKNRYGITPKQYLMHKNPLKDDVFYTSQGDTANSEKESYSHAIKDA